MTAVELNEPFLARIAGWEVLKQARGALVGGRVLSSNWSPPVLKGVVQEGGTSYRCGLVIKDAIDIENLCTCRTARNWGAMCVHSIAVGLHHLQKTSSPQPSPRAGPPADKPTAPGKPERNYKRARRAPDGTPAAISVVFPPNVSGALAKGKVMVYFEAATGAGVSPLNALASRGACSFSPEDERLLDVIESIAGDTPAMLLAAPDELCKVLAALVGHPRVTLGKNQPLEIEAQPVKLRVEARLEETGGLRLRLKDSPPAAGLIRSSAGNWLFTGNGFQPIVFPPGAEDLISGEARLERGQIPLFLSGHWARFVENCEVEANFRLEQFEFGVATPEIILELAGGLANLEAKLRFNYGGKILTAGASPQTESVWIADPGNPFRYGTRDLAAENHALNRLSRAGFTGPHDEGKLQLAGQNAVLDFFAREYPRLEREWTIRLEERLERSTSRNLERIEPRFEIHPSGEQWFDLDVAYQSGSGEKFSPAEIQRLIRSGQSHARLGNGKFAILDTGAVEELQEVLRDCSPRQHDNRFRISNTQAGFLALTLDENPDWRVSAPNSWREKTPRRAGEAQFETPPLGSLEAVLRPYQKQGVAWLDFLRTNGFGGILADEMGLGKTLQTLALLRTVAARTPADQRLPSMIICPTSLVFNWLSEAARFTPELRVLPLQGPRRQELFTEIPRHDLVITSYALARRDADQYRGLEFDTLVLDEAQHIKNRQTQNAQAVKSIRSRRRFVLTGTPMENSVLDLWSIFDFLMPGYLGPEVDFKERYELPIAREGNPEAQARLARRIRPFLLRRLKREVARDLPEKIEQVSFCELTSEQHEVYRQLLEASRQEITAAVGARGIQKSRMVILTALLRLRQACCDLRLLKLENAGENNSGKMDLFNELLQEVIDGGHRALVFSQFVEMLQLLKANLQAQNIAHAYLDGSTPDRARVVQQFQSDPDIPVFLISLKAGGVGLNLSAADTIIHFDPWWNPAVEAQATDRAHRIGQTRVVTSYKLITRGTVEEKILQLQNRKRELIQGTLGGEEQLAGALSWEELQGLFEA